MLQRQAGSYGQLSAQYCDASLANFQNLLELQLVPLVVQTVSVRFFPL